MALWRHIVDDILHFVMDHSVDVVDIYRLDHNSVWENTNIGQVTNCMEYETFLSRASKFKRGILIVSEEPIDERRRQAFDRLKFRAEKAGIRVSVDDGILL